MWASGQGTSTEIGGLDERRRDCHVFVWDRASYNSSPMSCLAGVVFPRDLRFSRPQDSLPEYPSREALLSVLRSSRRRSGFAVRSTTLQRRHERFFREIGSCGPSKVPGLRT